MRLNFLNYIEKSKGFHIARTYQQISHRLGFAQRNQSLLYHKKPSFCCKNLIHNALENQRRVKIRRAKFAELFDIFRQRFSQTIDTQVIFSQINFFQ